MKLKNKFFALFVTVSILPAAAVAQTASQKINYVYTGKDAVQTAPAKKSGLMVPASLQPVDIKPQMVPALEVLQPTAEENNYKDASQELFKKEFSGATNSSGLTMEKLLSEAYEKNPAINSAREGLKTVDEQYYQALSGYLPRVDYNFARSFDKTTPLGGTEGDYYVNNRSLNVTQGIFGGGETYFAVESARNKVIAARNELRNSEKQFLLEAINSYINFIYAKKVLASAENNMNVLQEQLNASKQRFVVGDATKTDVAQSEARLANASSSKVVAQSDFISAQSEFKKIFNVDAPDDLPMPSNLPDIPASLDEALKLGLEKNPELNQIKYLVESRDNDISVQQSQLYPQVDVKGSLNNSETPVSSGVFKNDSESVALNVRVPLYDAGVTYSRTREARDRRNQVKQQYNDTLNKIRSEIIQAWQLISTTQTNIEATKASLTAFDFALQGVREEQKEGARTILDVLDAEQERFSAEISHARAIKDAVLAIYKMKASLGELTPSQLNLSITEYDPEVHFDNTKFKLIGM